MEVVELLKDGHVATLRFANPPRHTLTARMVTRMHEHLATLEADDATRVLVLRSATPQVFITHYEVVELVYMAEQTRSGEGGERQAGARELHTLHRLTLRLEALHCVTVAVMDGSAMGGGLELALGCDFRVLRDGPYRLGLPETSVGIMPGSGGTQRLARLLGVARALDLVLHGTIMSPRDALANGLVSRLFAADSFEDDARRFVETLAARAPRALALAKRVIREGSDASLRDGLLLEQQAFEATLATDDARNAMAAWLRGETYTFKGE